MRWHVYLVRCKDGSLYCGIAADLTARLLQHNSGRGAKYIVPSRRPVECVWRRTVADKSRALRLEYWIKQLDVAEKRSLAEGAVTPRAHREDGWRLVNRPPRGA